MCFGTRGALRSPTTASCWIADSFLEVFKRERGGSERLTDLLSWFLATSDVARSEPTMFCVFPTCIFKPISDLKSLSHWSHCLHRASGDPPFQVLISQRKIHSQEDHVSLQETLLSYRHFFFELMIFFVKDEVTKKEPTLRVKLKICHLLASAWQKAMHWNCLHPFQEQPFSVYLNLRFSAQG